MHNGIFEGGFRRLPEQNLAGASRNTRKVDFLQQLNLDRLNRKNNIKRNQCATKLQAIVRGFLDRRRWRKQERDSFSRQISPFQDRDISFKEFSDFLQKILVFYEVKYDRDILVWASSYTLRFQREIFNSLDKIWLWRIKHLLFFNMKSLNSSSPCPRNVDVVILPLQIIFSFTNPEVVNACLPDISKEYSDQILSYLVRNGYFHTLRCLVDEFRSSDCVSGIPLPVIVTQLIERALLVLYSHSNNRVNVVENLCLEVLNKPVTENMKLYVLPCLMGMGENLFFKIVDVFIEKSIPPSLLSLFYVILQFCKSGGLFKSNSGTGLVKTLDMLSILCANLSKYNIHKKKFHSQDDYILNDVDDEDEEDDEDIAELDEKDVTPEILLTESDNEMLLEFYEFLISPELADYTLQAISNGEKSIILFPLSKFLHSLIISHPLAMTRYKVLSCISFKPSLHKDMWKALINLKRDGLNGSSYSLASVVSKGQLLKPEEAETFYPLLTTFSATFKNFLTILHNDEFYRLEESEEKMMPFTMLELIDICIKLRDISLGLLQIAYPDTQVISSHLPDISNNKFQNHIGSCLQDPNMYLCLKEIVCLLRLLHSRNLKLDQSNKSFWVSEKIIVPRNVPFHQMDHILNVNKPFISNSPILYCDAKRINSALISFMFILKEIPFCVSAEKRILFLQSLIQQSKFEFQNPNLHFLHALNVFVNIRRDYLYEDAFEKLSIEQVPEIRIAVRIQLTSAMGYEEAGVDGGGIFREFLYEFMKAAFDPNRGFFLLNRNNQLYPNPHVQLLYPDFKRHYFFIGRMLGKALYENMLVELPLAEFFVAKLVGSDMDLNLSSLDSLDPELFKNLVSLRTYNGDFGDLGLNFTIVSNEFGETKVIELKKNGEETAVTKMNKLEYIYLVADYKLNKQIKAQCAALKQGISSVIPIHWLSMFSPNELQVIISGADCPIDIDDLSERTVYTGGYSNTHPNIIMFWKVVKSFSDIEKRQLLKFVTSCSRPPLLGFKDLDPPFTIQLVESSDRLPTASTCTNLLKLPIFPDKSIMKQKILYSIQSGAGFELC